jgi:hypothetical protein
MRPSQLGAAAAVVLAVAVAACSGGSNSPTVPIAGSGPTTTAAGASGSPAGGATPLAQGLAYSKCLRSHGVPNWPDPVLTPSGGYGYRTTGVDPKSAVFLEAQQACKALIPQWWSSTGQQLTPAQQQAWLNWAKCIRSHGVPNLPDPTFPGGGAVQISGGGGASFPVPQSALDACKSQMPSAGGLGG